ncbi:MAG: hypothetical protein IT459_17480, partial [Planctomycetes bacterium]|nr:hypothetical protein [Planctomycetota bacterium]
MLRGRVAEGDLELALRPGSQITLADAVLAGAVLAMGADESYDGPDSPPVSVLTLELATPIHVALRVQAKRSVGLADSMLVAAKRGKPGDARLDPKYDVWAEEPEQANAFLAALPAREVLPAIDAT